MRAAVIAAPDTLMNEAERAIKRAGGLVIGRDFEHDAGGAGLARTAEEVAQQGASDALAARRGQDTQGQNLRILAQALIDQQAKRLSGFGAGDAPAGSGHCEHGAERGAIPSVVGKASGVKRGESPKASARHGAQQDRHDGRTG